MEYYIKIKSVCDEETSWSALANQSFIAAKLLICQIYFSTHAVKRCKNTFQRESVLHTCDPSESGTRILSLKVNM